MKRLLLLAGTALSLLLAGCLDTTEEITISENGTATYKSTMDMSGMFDMIEMMASMDTSANSALAKMKEQDIDSLISLDSYADTASGLTDEQRRLVKGATLRLTMKQEDRVFRVGMDFGSKPLSDLARLMEFSSSGRAFSLLDKNAAPPTDEGMPNFGELYEISFAPGRLVRTVDSVKLQEFKNNPQMQGLEQASEMLESMTYSTVIRLPRPAKNAVGPKVSLSDDRRTVTVKTTLADLLNKPSDLHYRIEY